MNPNYPAGAFFKSNMGPTRAEAKSARVEDIEAARRKAYRAVDKRDGLICRVCERQMQTKVLGVDLAEHHHIAGRGGIEHETSTNIARICRGCHDDRHVKRILHISGDANKTLRCERGKAVWLSPNPKLKAKAESAVGVSVERT